VGRGGATAELTKKTLFETLRKKIKNKLGKDPRSKPGKKGDPGKSRLSTIFKRGKNGNWLRGLKTWGGGEKTLYSWNFAMQKQGTLRKEL